MQSNKKIKAYVQGDWEVNPVSSHYDHDLSQNYSVFLKELESTGLINVATWHTDGKGVGKHDRSADVIRNYKQIDHADVVITYILKDNPHRSGLCCMAYGIGKNKPCYVICPDEFNMWKSSCMYHPLIHKMDSISQLITEIKNI